MNPPDYIGLELTWNRPRGLLMVLQLILGMKMSPVAKHLQFAGRSHVKIFKRNNLTKISIPSLEILEEYRSIITACHLALHIVWDTIFPCLILRSSFICELSLHFDMHIINETVLLLPMLLFSETVPRPS